jgi:hypothetical protein
MTNETHRPVCVAYIDKDGETEYMICGDAVLLTIDDRCPNDRVYSISRTITREELTSLIGDSETGSAHDARHPALEARILGQRLKLVHDADQQ